MANLACKRVSTGQQPAARQDLVLDEAGIEDPVVLEEDGGTSSRLHPWSPPSGRARPGGTVRRGQGYTLRVTAVPAVHRGLLAPCQPLDGQDLPAVPAQRKARREYENRVSTLAPIGP